MEDPLPMSPREPVSPRSTLPLPFPLAEGLGWPETSIYLDEAFECYSNLQDVDFSNL